MEVRSGRVRGGRGEVAKVETESPIWKLYKTLGNLGKRLWKQKEHRGNIQETNLTWNHRTEWPVVRGREKEKDPRISVIYPLGKCLDLN